MSSGQHLPLSVRLTCFRYLAVNKASEQISALRDLLKHVDHPQRLSGNPLAVLLFRDGHDQTTGSARVKRLIERILDELPKRQREIIRRCDLRGEAHATVTSALAVSERHFYRERRSAFEFVSAALARAARTAVQTDLDHGQDAVALQLAFAEAAHQVGDITSAIRALREACANAVDHTSRFRFLCRLAELYGEAGATDDARRQIEIARSIGHEGEEETERVGAHVDALEALVAWMSDDSVSGVRLASRARGRLRRTLIAGASAADAEAFALASLVLNDTEINLGRWQSARDIALEAHRALAVSESRREGLRVRVESAAAAALMLEPMRLADAGREYEQLYRGAVSRGCTLEAVKVGWLLAQFHRFVNSPRRTVAKFQGLLPLVRHVVPAEERARMCLEVASAHLACGEPAQAHRMIAEAQTYASPGGFSAALSCIIDADAYCFERTYGRALSLSRLGLDAMRRLNRAPSVGSALRIQADATFALGDRERAKALIGEALSHLDSTGHPFVVARAHRSAARITGRGSHQRIASDILAKLTVSAGAIASG